MVGRDPLRVLGLLAVCGCSGLANETVPTTLGTEADSGTTSSGEESDPTSSSGQTTTEAETASTSDATTGTTPTSSAETTNGSDSTTGDPPPIDCHDGVPAPGEQCHKLVYAIPVGTDPLSVATGDLNGDNHIDIAVGFLSLPEIQIIWGTGDGFSDVVAIPILDAQGSDIVAIGDFNGDNELDLFAADVSERSVYVLFGDGGGNFSPPVATFATAGARDVAVWNFDNQGALDVVIVGPGNFRFAVGNGDGSFNVGDPIDVGAEPFYIADVDFDGDGYRDAVISNRNSGSVTPVMNEQGVLGPIDELDVETQPAGVAAADLDGDDLPDIVVANRGTNTIAVIRQAAGAGFHEPEIFDVDDTPTPVFLTDFDGDDLPDLVVGHQGNVERVDIRLGIGDGSFGAAQQFGISNDPTDFAVADLNEDGVLDLVVASAMGDEISVILSDP